MFNALIKTRGDEFAFVHFNFKREVHEIETKMQSIYVIVGLKFVVMLMK